MDDKQKQSKSTLETVAGMNHSLLELPHQEHGTVLKQLQSLYELRVFEEQTEMQRLQKSAAMQKALSLT